MTDRAATAHPKRTRIQACLACRTPPPSTAPAAPARCVRSGRTKEGRPLLTAAARALALLLYLPALAWSAGEIDLAGRIAKGDWLLTYQRSAIFKPLGLKQKESGSSHVCMESDPRRQILAWVTGKGCRVDQESLRAGTYRLHGTCRLKWWKSRPIPVSVELTPETADTFSMEIRTDEDSLLDFVESTKAVRQGDCPPPSAAKGEQDKGG